MLCRLLADHASATTVRTLGCTELPGAGMSYSVEVVLTGDRELLVDVERL
jgi:hypothetical protein